MRPTPIRADPEKWSEKSKTSLQYELNWIKEYVDRPYLCWTCKTRCVFTAQDQKYTYETKKAYIGQQRNLCMACWTCSNEIAHRIRTCETRWAKDKPARKIDIEFLLAWLELLKQRERYTPYRSNSAQMNMLRNLIGKVTLPVQTSSDGGPRFPDSSTRPP